MNIIKVNDLCFSYPAKKDALKNVNFAIKEGTFNCIVGENGSRKKHAFKMYS